VFSRGAAGAAGDKQNAHKHHNTQTKLAEIRIGFSPEAKVTVARRTMTCPESYANRAISPPHERRGPDRRQRKL
jgi:hypothetical protein